MTRKRVLGALGAAGVLTAGVGALGATLIRPFSPAPTEEVSVHCGPEVPRLERGRPLRVLVWNVQFAAGRGQEFFYDGGEAVSVSAETVHEKMPGSVPKKSSPPRRGNEIGPYIRSTYLLRQFAQCSLLEYCEH